jgi:serine/threonine protein kinase
MAEVTPGSSNRFGPYLVQQKLGGGGMAVVYKALNEESGQTIALKVLRASLSEQPGVVERFKQEATIANRLQHPHIVAVNSYGTQKGRFYLDLQYMPGGTLAQRFKKPIEMGTQEAIRLLRHVSSALDYAHRQGVIHRDLKLENILLDKRGDAGLSDFGIARILDGSTRLTATGSVIGTPMYISPEQARGEAHLDHRADLYSLAVIAYVLVAGRFPFNGDNMLAILNQHVSDLVPTPSSINPNLPKNLDVVLLKGLSKRKEERYPSADTFVEALSRAWSSDGQTQNTVIDLWSDHAGRPIVIDKSLTKNADDWVKAAEAAPDTAEAISCLKKALELEPLHSKANRMLFQIEGARSMRPDRPASSTPVPRASELAPLKKVNRKGKRGLWFYIGILAFILSSVSTAFFVLSFTGSPIAGQITSLVTGKRPVNEINGTPVRQIPNVVLTIEPYQNKEIRDEQRVSDVLDSGIAHQYYFAAHPGEEVDIGVWFVSPTANRVAHNIAILDPNGNDARGLCEYQQLIPGADTNVGYFCTINQSGNWQVRIFGIEGESTGAYFITIERP